MKDRILLGTWQFGGDFGIISDCATKELLVTAFNYGIRRFDTAMVYGNGRIEKFLGEALPCDALVLTKIPALNKPRLDESADLLHTRYPQNLVTSLVSESLVRLKRSNIDTILLHNWTREWVTVNQPIIELMELKRNGVVDKIGISLPDGFRSRLGEEICKNIDVIEAPYNHLESWIRDDIIWYQNFGIDVILRSLFAHGLRLKSNAARQFFEESDIRAKKSIDIPFDPQGTMESIFLDALSLNTSLVFGATSPAHIIENMSFLNSKL